MGENMTTQRAAILASVTARLDARFGPSGTTGKWLRAVWRRPWMPGNTLRPSATVVDLGEQQAGGARSDETKKRTLFFQVVLDLEAQLEREAVTEDWTERVATINQAIQNFDAQSGCLRLDATRDEPIEVALQSGAAEHIWVLEYECDYVWGVAAFGP